MTQMIPHDVCEFCDGEVEQRVTRARFSFKGRTIYVDGVSVTTDTFIGPIGTNSHSLIFGNYSDPTRNRPINCILDDVQLYNRALTQEEIAWSAGRITPFDKPF